LFWYACSFFQVIGNFPSNHRDLLDIYSVTDKTEILIIYSIEVNFIIFQKWFRF